MVAPRVDAMVTPGRRSGRDSTAPRCRTHSRTIGGDQPLPPIASMYLNKYTRPMLTALEVRFYQSSRGTEPVHDWLRALPREARKVIGQDIKTVQLGWPLGMPLVRKVDAGLWEVRCHVPTGIARVLFTVEESTMVLLHGFVKKSARTPRSDLETARSRKREIHHGKT